MNTFLALNTPPAGPFTGELWESNRSLTDEIIYHPFCKGMSDGTLPADAFRHYLAQDLLYIEQDARAFAITAGRASTYEAFSFFIDMARDGLEIERNLHRDLLPFFGVERPDKMSRICRGYTTFLLDTALKASYPESVAALLPCFWVYRETGLKIRKDAVKKNPFQKWLETYSDEAYGSYVEQFIQIAEELLFGATLTMRKKMHYAFRRSCEFEKAFFSEALNIKKDKEKKTGQLF
ncbi:thiaminase II [Marinilabilia salmonicolor]|uniref:Aminopyrimidine aminohydrolase n=1 Tax=Marinilabilia salmonicolor TaxID=989 RepID=A0A368VI76_9BACT|nr:thiaminase II [Marinilabilia salmonicolor]RCW38711.1 thiaminase /4-amino-5-aminomethyl-2-methylpyrimidine deaminase [Marinilabilia salmonicolor]